MHLLFLVNPFFSLTTTSTTASTSTSTELDAKKRVVVIGKVGQRFMEKIFLEDTDPEDVQLSTFCDEPRLELPSPFGTNSKLYQ